MITQNKEESSKFRPEPPEIEYVNQDRLRYRGLEIAKRSITVRMHDQDWQGLADVQYTVIKKTGKVLARFDRLRHPLGAYSRFGLFSFLGSDDKHLVVEQTLPRAWQYWIADLKPGLRVVYDSSKYNVGHELSPEDIDGDGVYEFWQSLFTFWFFDRLCGACSPRIGIVFKYDRNAHRYSPANHLFPDRVLDGIEGNISKVKELNSTTDFTKLEEFGGGYLEKVMMVIVPYIYAGKEKEAWEFYDREYRMKDKTEMKRKIKAQLKRCAVYRFIYRR